MSRTGTLSVGDELEVAIEKPVAGGRMLARAGGRVVLVSGAIPGERITARIERVAKGVTYATVAAIDEPSPDRRPVAGDALCGGCLYAHVAYARQLDLKARVIEDAFARVARLTLPGPLDVAGSPEVGYRMRARLHIRGRHVGFFREGTHEVCEVRQTGQLLPTTCEAIGRLQAALGSLGLDAVREIELSENVDASARAVYLDSSAPIDARQLDLVGVTDGLTGVASRSGMCGNVHVTDALTISGRTVAIRHHVLAFFQANRYLLEPLVAHVVSQLPASERVLDLYAGVGLFSLATATVHTARVTAIECDPVAAADLRANAAGVGDTVVAIHQPVEEYLRWVHARNDERSHDAVIVDPPRTGMSREALDGVIRIGAPRIVYVSCDTATLARDARRLVDAGYTLTRLEAFDLFPNTPHVETVAVFER